MKLKLTGEVVARAARSDVATGRAGRREAGVSADDHIQRWRALEFDVARGGKSAAERVIASPGRLTAVARDAKGSEIGPAGAKPTGHTPHRQSGARASASDREPRHRRGARARARDERPGDGPRRQAAGDQDPGRQRRRLAARKDLHAGGHLQARQAFGRARAAVQRQGARSRPEGHDADRRSDRPAPGLRQVELEFANPRIADYTVDGNVGDGGVPSNSRAHRMTISPTGAESSRRETLGPESALTDEHGEIECCPAPNCELCDVDLPPARRTRGLQLRMHVLRRVRRDRAAQRVPQLREVAWCHPDPTQTPGPRPPASSNDPTRHPTPQTPIHDGTGRRAHRGAVRYTATRTVR